MFNHNHISNFNCMVLCFVQLDAVIAKYELELPGIVSSRLAQKQLELIESRADDLLAWFCNTNIDDQSALNLEVRES